LGEIRNLYTRKGVRYHISQLFNLFKWILSYPTY